MAVTVVDPLPGRGASWAAAGMLAPVGEARFDEDALTALNLHAARAWPGFVDALEEASGQSVHYLARGTLMVAVDASDQAEADDVLAYQRTLGLPACRLSARECRALGAAVGPRDPIRRRPTLRPPGRQPLRGGRTDRSLPGGCGGVRG